MKISQISEHIYRLHVWFVIPINVWLVVENDGLTLVDTGISPMVKGITRTIERLGKGSLRQILLTHGHSDHVGGVPGILKSTKVPVFVHPIELPYMEGRATYLRRKRPAIMLQPGIARSLALDSRDRPRSIGDLIPLLTPGHSPGHVVYFHQGDEVLLAGDLFTSRKGRLRLPMPLFTGDMAEAVRSSEVLREIIPKHLEVCHGGPVENPIEQLDDYVGSFRPSRKFKNRKSTI